MFLATINRNLTISLLISCLLLVSCWFLNNKDFE
jgi:hypothetical protein